MAQSKSTRSRKSELSTIERGHQTMDGRSPALRFLRSQIQCILHKSPSDETINRGPPRLCVCMQKDHITHVKGPVVHVRIRWTMETTK